MNKKVFFLQSFRYGAVGVLNTVLGYLLFFVLLKWYNYLVALIIASIICAIHSYLWNRYWTFKSNGAIISELLKFITINTLYLSLNSLLLLYMVEVWGIGSKLAQAIALLPIMLIGFIGHKYWSFSCKNGFSGGLDDKSGDGR